MKVINEKKSFAMIAMRQGSGSGIVVLLKIAQSEVSCSRKKKAAKIA